MKIKVYDKVEDFSFIYNSDKNDNAYDNLYFAFRSCIDRLHTSLSEEQNKFVYLFLSHYELLMNANLYQYSSFNRVLGSFSSKTLLQYNKQLIDIHITLNQCLCTEKICKCIQKMNVAIENELDYRCVVEHHPSFNSDNYEDQVAKENLLNLYCISRRDNYNRECYKRQREEYNNASNPFDKIFRCEIDNPNDLKIIKEVFGLDFASK